MLSPALQGTMKTMGLIGASGFLLVAFALFALQSLAHHSFAMAEGADLTPLQGLIIGLRHPLLDPDHLLFCSPSFL